jgi:hypothetical protein
MGDEYSFLQETIKDEAGSAKSLRKKIFRMILCGMIFGIVACFTFFALKPWVEGIFEKDGTEITIPEDEEEAAEHLISCLTEAGYNIIDWNTNGSNVFIFALDPENAFDLDFDDIDVFGKNLTEAKKDYCCICGESIDGYGNNPEPYRSSADGRCCDACNFKFVVPARMALLDMEEL